MSADTFSPPCHQVLKHAKRRRASTNTKKLFQLFLFHETHNKAQREIIIHSPDMENQISIVFDDFMFSWILPWKVGLYYKSYSFSISGNVFKK